MELLSSLETHRQLDAKVWPASSFCEPYDFHAQWIGTEFVTKAIHRGKTLGIQLEGERWRAMASADPIITRPFKGKPQKERAVTVETVVGSLCATFCKEVHFTEPDIACTFDSNTISIAVKEVNSNRKNLWRRTDDGLRQALNEARRSGTQSNTDIVLHSVANIFPVRSLFAESWLRQHQHPKDITGWAREWVRRWSGTPGLRRHTRRVSSSRDAAILRRHAVVYFVPLLLWFRGRPTFFPYVHVPFSAYSGGDVGYEWARQFMHACQRTRNDVEQTTSPRNEAEDHSATDTSANA